MPKNPTSTADYLKIAYPVMMTRETVWDTDGDLCKCETPSIAERIALALNACRTLTIGQLRDQRAAEVIGEAMTDHLLRKFKAAVMAAGSSEEGV